MKHLLNKVVLVEFGSSAITGPLREYVEGQGILVQNNSDGKIWYITLASISVLKEN